MLDTLPAAALPFLGTILGLLLRDRPRVLKVVALLATGLTAIGLLSGLVQASDATATGLMTLFAFTGFVAILGQQFTRDAPRSMIATLLVLGLGTAALGGSQSATHLFLGAIMAATALLLWRTIRPADALARGAVAWLGFGTAVLAASALVSGSPRVVLQLVAYAILLPLFPLQTAFVGSLSSLPGTLPVLLAVVFPCLGWHGVATLASAVPAPVQGAAVALALGGALYEAVRASVQVHLFRIIASLTTTLFALAWWSVGVTGTVTPEAGWYLAAVSLAASGLLLAGHLLEARYGFVDLDNLRGLARPMPRFAVAVGLVLTGAMGLPLFGVFSAFLAMLFVSTGPMSQSAVIVLVIWLVASLLFMRLFQRLLYGQPKPDLLYRDLSWGELLPLVLVLCLLGLGLATPWPLSHPAAQARAAVVAEGAP